MTKAPSRKATAEKASSGLSGLETAVVLGIVTAAIVVPVRAGAVMCDGTPQENANQLCDSPTSDPCVIGRDFTLPSGCVLDFGAREVVVQKVVMVGLPAPSCTACCDDFGSDLCGGALDLHARAVTVACSGRILAPAPTQVPADTTAAGGAIRIAADEDIVVRGRIDASGPDEGGHLTLLPGRDLILDGHGAGCAGVVVADGTREGTVDEEDGGAGGVILFGADEDDDFPRTRAVSIVSGGALRARGGRFGTGGEITGAACGNITIASSSEISALGSEGIDPACGRDGGDIDLTTDTLTVDGVIRAGQDGCHCLAPPSRVGRSCSTDAACNSERDSGDGRCGGVASSITLTARTASVTGSIDPLAECQAQSCAAGCSAAGVCLEPDLLCCGNGVLDAPEQCDDGTNDRHGPCPDCRLPACGDRVRNQPTEQCDGLDLGSATCVSLGFDGGPLACTTTCGFDTSACELCGNGRREGAEQCDGVVAGLSCQDFGFSGGLLACFPPGHARECQLDVSGCSVCGDRLIGPGEVCDGSNLAGATCESLGNPEGGPLACAANCRTFDTRGCFVCGNGRIEADEQCDGPALGGATCNAPGETGGVPTCDSACRIDRTTCFFCGNSRVDPGEECDDGNAALGDGCRPDCRTECGNGSVERNEECDDGARVAGDGCSPQCAREAPFGGGGAAQDCALEWGVAGGNDSRVQMCQDGDPRCDRESEPDECAFRLFYCFNVAEPIIGGSGSCVPREVARVELRRASVVGRRALSPVDLDGLLVGMGNTLARGGATVTRAEATLTATPPVTDRRLCGAATIHVPLRAVSGRTLFGVRRLLISTTDARGLSDRDSINLICQP